MNNKEKLSALKKAWGYLQISQVTLTVSAWRMWLIKNYAGKPIAKMNGTGLPGNPKATRKLEYTGYNARQAINRAYELTIKTPRERRKG